MTAGVAPCGCCAPTAPGVPVDVENRPGLPAIAYRVGTFATFRHALLTELAATPELAALRTRLSDDYSITAVELWSAVADVLTFYQERIANEGFLRTARLRDSVRRLVRLIDYQLHPGAAATTQLAFTLEAGARVVLPKGLRVQSVPAGDEKPQKFETLEPSTADARFNRLSIVPRPTWRDPQAGDDAASLVSGAASLAALKQLQVGARLAAFDTTAGSAQFLIVQDRIVERDRVKLVWSPPLNYAHPDWATNPNEQRAIYRVGRSFRLFGLDSPPTYIITTPDNTDPKWIATNKLMVSEAQTSFKLTGDGSNTGSERELYLDAKYSDLVVGSLLLIVVDPTKSTGPRGANAAQGEAQVVRISNVGTVTAARGLSHGATTRLVVTRPDGSDIDLPVLIDGQGSQRTDGAPRTTIYELEGEPLRLWPYVFPTTLGAAEIYVPGVRTSWDALEVSRIIEKNELKAGVTISPREIERGRPIILSDALGHVVAGTVATVEIVGAQLALGPFKSPNRPFDLDTVRLTGLDAGQAERATALASTPLQPMYFTHPHPEILVTIGAHPPQRIALASSISIATDLEAGINQALPGVPAFARARVLVAKDNRLLIVPGIPGAAVSVTATAADTTTVEQLGLLASMTTFVDGLLSAPIQPLTAAATGVVTMAVGFENPFTFTLGLSANDGAPEIAAALAGVTPCTATTVDDRILIFPPVLPAETASYLEITVKTDSAARLDSNTAVLLGNVAPASHGETVKPEILGDGDAARPFQRFKLAKKPVTHVANPRSGVLESTLTVLVNGTRWHEVPTRYGRSPSENVYITRLDDDQTMNVMGGDGDTGARFPTGRANVVATYRQGLGLAGRVAARTLTTLLDRPNGLRAAVNPSAADGGADPESLEHARETAPGQVRSFGRAVSLRDFEDVALATGEVAKASVTWVWTGLQRAVHLTIAAQGGAPFSAEGLARIRLALDAQRDPNYRLLVDNVSRVPIVVSAHLNVKADYVQGDVLNTARNALLGSLSFAALAFARPVHLSDIFAVLQGVAGVESVDVDDLDFKTQDAVFRADHGAIPNVHPQPHLLLLPARPQDGAAPLPAEQAWVEVPSQDVVLTATGGITV